jgi:hypothetical protein
MRIIDPPSPFASLQECERFLREMEGIILQDDDEREQVKDAVAEAKARISEHRSR